MTLVLSLVGTLGAASVQWTGAAGDGLWSNPLNWAGGVVPADGDDVDFGASGSPQARLDFSLMLGSFTFDTNATSTDIHVGAGTASTLTLSGVGIVNNTPSVPGQGPQNFFADASSGPVGGTLLFTNTASVSGSIATTLTASGATVAGGGGGSIIFQDHSSTAINDNFNGLIAGGATVAGAGSGTVILRDDALAQSTTQITARGGTGAGAAGGQITVQDQAQIQSNVTVLQGDGGGYGGRVDFHNNAVLTGGLLTLFGATSSLDGGEAVGRFFDNATLVNGVAAVYGGQGTGFAGARLEFHNQATLASAGTTPGYNNASINNYGAPLPGAGNGRTLFYDDSSITGPQVTIYNSVDESTTPGTAGGSTEFHDHSHAGQVTIYNYGANAAGAGTTGGQTLFYDNSSAELAIINAVGSHAAGAPGGRVVFDDNSTAGAASLVASVGFNGGEGGRIVFLGNANGGTAYIGLDGDGTAGAANGTLDISGSTRASVSIGLLDGTAGLVNLGDRNLAIVGGQAGIVAYFGGTIRGAGGSLTTAGPGIVSLGGASTYTGNTLVSSGALLLSYGSLASPLVTVNSGATFGGNGTVSGLVDLAAGANLAPSYLTSGASVLNLGALSSVAGTNFNFKLGAPDVVGGPLNDLVNVAGNLTLAGTLNVTNSGGFGVGSYRLINYGGTLTGAGLALGAFPAGFLTSDFTIQTSVAGQINLVVGGANVLFWDGAHTTPNSVVDGGTGTWNNSTTNWTNAGGTTNVAWSNRFSVFSGTAGTVTVAEPVTSTGMQFSTDGYMVNASGTGAIALSGAATIRTDPGTATTINAPLTGSGSLTKLDTGTLTLGGSSTYSGGTTIQDGLVIVTNAAGLGLGTGPVLQFATAASELDFVNHASAGSVTITNVGAPSTAVSAFVQFEGNATAGSATINNQGNTASGGFGGQVNFASASSAGNAVITNAGSAFAPPVGAFAENGAGITIFLNNATAGNATFLNTAGLATNTLGGRVFFVDSASAGASTITNQGAFAYGNGGLTEFSGNATAGTATVFNQAATIAVSNGGTVNFRDNSSAGSATFTQSGSGVASAGTSSAGGAVTFYNTSSAANGTFFNQEAAAAFTYGGATTFRDTSTAGAATITNGNGSTDSGAGGGHLVFSDNATAGNAVITSEGGSVAAPDSGYASFIASATAGSATLSAGGGTAAGAAGGRINFSNNSTAANATLIANGGTGGGGAGSIVFADNAGGGTARVVLDGGTLDISVLASSGLTIGSLEGDGGNVLLGGKLLSVGVSNTDTTYDGAISGSGILIKAGTGSLTLAGASTYTGGTSIADGQLIVTNPAGLALGTGLVTNNPTVASELRFTGNGSAGNVTISDVGSTSTAFSLTSFYGTATAGTAKITNQASAGTGGTGGESLFSDAATAGSATITNATGMFLKYGLTSFQGNSNAGSATIINAGGVAAVLPSDGLGFGGRTLFGMNASAGTSTIINHGAQAGDVYLNASTAYGGQTIFSGNSTAGNSTIFNEGGALTGPTSGGLGSYTYFEGNSTAGNATLYAESPGNGFAMGGTIRFEGNASGGTARAIIEGNTINGYGYMDVSPLSTPGMTIGSIEGGGFISLGSKNLQVGGNGLSTTFSGSIVDNNDQAAVVATGGSLTVAGPGASLRLTGANTYTGGTSIGDGLNPNSGKLIAANTTGSATGTGPVTINRGGTLGGSGFVAGPVTLHAGGTIAPGDPTTLTLQNNLLWDGGGTIRLVLGADQAHSDFLSIEGTLARGATLDGPWTFDLVDDGIVVGQTYKLVSFADLAGFTASDFTFAGVAGDFSFQNGTLDFTVNAVPEPGAGWWLISGGLIAVVTARRQRRGTTRTCAA